MAMDQTDFYGNEQRAAAEDGANDFYLLSYLILL